MLNEIDSKILQRLQEWEQRNGQLPSYVEFYRQMLRIQSEAKSHISVAKPSLAETLVHQLRQGIPLLSFENLCLDWDQLRTVLEQIVVWVAKDSEEPSEESERLINIARNGSLLREVVSTWFRGHSLTAIATVQCIDEELLTSMVGTVLKPFLSAYSELLLPEVDQELWRHRHCPICGGKPDFAYLDRERGARWLLCCRCDAEWLFQRLECPYCGTQDQNALAYFTDDEEVYLYRLYVCERCRKYIKAIDLRKTESEILMPLERIVTLNMDRQGQEKGYKPGWTSLNSCQGDAIIVSKDG